MRIITTTMFLLVGIAALAQLPNSGFENWTTHTIYEEPTPWQNGNQDNDSVVVTKSTDAYSGSFSCHLRTLLEASGDTAFGYVTQGDPAGSGAGFACSAAPDSIVGYYKCDVKANDTALVMCVPSFNGNPTGQALVKITGIQSTWKRFAMRISYGVQISDSLTVAAASSNAFLQIMTPGSWLMLDSLHVKKGNSLSCAIPGHSFENWTALTYKDPDNWGSLNREFAIFGIGGDTIITQTSDANSGNSAVKLTTSVFGQDTAYALLSLGGWDLDNNEGIGIPFTLQYAYLNGYYKSTPAVSSDTAAILFEAFNSGTSLGQDAMQLAAAANYTGFSLPLTYASTPDTVSVIFYPGDADGSVAYFDDVQLSAWPVFIEDNLQLPVKVYPNPAADFITIEGLNTGTVVLYDVNGRVALSTAHQFNQTIDVSALAAGVYVIEVKDQTNQVVNKQKIAIH